MNGFSGTQKFKNGFVLSPIYVKSSKDEQGIDT